MDFTIVGSGQERSAFDQAVSGISNISTLDWLAYDQLGGLVADHHVVLGVFSAGQRAGSVVPNKVYQAACAGRAVVTADTPAMRAAFGEDEVVLVPPDDPWALASELRDLAGDRERVRRLGRLACQRFESEYSLVEIGDELLQLLRRYPYG